MKKRILGKSGLEVSAVGLGCMGLNQGDLPLSDKAAFIAFLHRAVEMGQTFFDISGVCGYQNEEIVGEAMAPLRNQIIIANRFGGDIQNGKGVELDSQIIRKTLEASIRRLHTDYVDLYYYQHGIDSNVPIGEVAETMKELKQEGKILHWGLSEASLDTIRRAHDVFPISAVQNEYSMCFRRSALELLPTLEEMGIALVASSPLGKGFLAAAVTKDTVLAENEILHSGPRLNNPSNLSGHQKLVNALLSFAKARELTSAQVALAWLLCQKPWIVPLPRTRNVCHLQEDMSAAYVEISEKDWNELNELFSQREMSTVQNV